MASLVTRVVDQTQAQLVIIKYPLNHGTTCDEMNTCRGARALTKMIGTQRHNGNWMCYLAVALLLINYYLILKGGLGLVLFVTLEIGNSQCALIE
jgi:hypothetical protein